MKAPKPCQDSIFGSEEETWTPRLRTERQMVLGVCRRHGGTNLWGTGTVDQDEDYDGTKGLKVEAVRQRRKVHKDISSRVIYGNDPRTLDNHFTAG